jgi:hypothetical protein
MTTLQTQKLAQGSQQNKPLDEQMNKLSLKETAAKKKAKTRAKNARYQANKGIRIAKEQEAIKGKTNIELCNDMIEVLRLLEKQDQPKVEVTSNLDDLPSDSEDDLEDESDTEEFELRVAIVWRHEYDRWFEWFNNKVDNDTAKQQLRVYYCLEEERKVVYKQWITTGWKQETQRGIDFWTPEMLAQISQCTKIQAKWDKWCLWVPPPPPQ